MLRLSHAYPPTQVLWVMKRSSRPDAVALIDAAGRAHTYSEFLSRVEQTADRLRCSSKVLVFCLCRNDVASVVTCYAAIMAGHAAALVDADLPQTAYEALIGRYRPYFIAGSHHHPFPDYQRIPGLNGGATVLRRNDSPDTLIHPEVSLLLSTSGTTGSPKFVRLSERNLVANATSIINYLDLHAKERAIQALPIHYSYGLSVLNSHLLVGASVVLTKQGILSKEFWQTFDDYACTSFAGVPYSYHILQRIGFDRRLPPTLTTMTQAGGKLSPALAEHFYAALCPLGKRFFVMYGQTEATARISYVPPEDLLEKRGSIGVPIPEGHLDIRNDGQPITATRAEGEIFYSGPNVMLGYCSSREDLALGDVCKGVLATGDLGYRDDDGFFYITGRLKRISKIYGVRINLDEVEHALQHFGPVAAVSNDETIVVYHESEIESESERARLAELYRINPNSFLFRQIQALPRTTSGKLDYRTLEG